MRSLEDCGKFKDKVSIELSWLSGKSSKFIEPILDLGFPIKRISLRQDEKISTKFFKKAVKLCR